MSTWSASLRPLASLAAALAVLQVIVLVSSATPGLAMETILLAPISNARAIAGWIDTTAKLTLAGLAFAIVFRSRLFALGVQGQVYAGGLCAGLVALSPLGSTILALPLGLAAAALGGGLLGLAPGYAKARFGADEMVSTLMLNYVAIDVFTWLVRAHFAVEGEGLTFSPDFPPDSILPGIVPGTRIDAGILLALAVSVGLWFILQRTAFGLRLRLVGQNARFAAYAGIDAGSVVIAAMTLSGLIGGLLGGVFVQGRVFGKLAVGFEAGLSFEGIVIAIVAANRPLAVPIVALVYAYLRQGAILMGYRTDVPAEVIGIVEGAVMLFSIVKLPSLGRRS
jgi:simple sugar transport system permease protein